MLLRRRKPLPQIAVEKIVDRAGIGRSLVPAPFQVNLTFARHAGNLDYAALHPGYKRSRPVHPRILSALHSMAFRSARHPVDLQHYDTASDGGRLGWGW